MPRILLTLCLLLTLPAVAQNNPTEKAAPIVAEGKRLYRSEMASWNGTDLFLARYPDHDSIGGYFSYTEGPAAACVFFSKGDRPKIIGTIIFDSTYNTRTASFDMKVRDFTPLESDLYTLRKNALELMRADTLFKVYKNTSLNLIPLISKVERKVYVLTGPQKEGVVIFGNDYLLTFDQSNQLISKKQLHRNIIPIEYGAADTSSEQVEGTIHSHLPETGDFITATDICTLMLYEKYAKWKQHSVVSAKYLNIWSCETNQLTVIPMDVVNKINKDAEKRQKKEKN